MLDSMDEMPDWTGFTAEERKLRASLAAHARWKKTDTVTRQRQAERGQQALLEKFLSEVDPKGELPPKERYKRAENARQEHMKRLALKSSKARRTQVADPEPGVSAAAQGQ